MIYKCSSLFMQKIEKHLNDLSQSEKINLLEFLEKTEKGIDLKELAKLYNITSKDNILSIYIGKRCFISFIKETSHIRIYDIFFI